MFYTDEDAKYVDQLNTRIESSLLRALYLDGLVSSEGKIVTIATVDSLCRFYVFQAISHRRPHTILALKNFESLLQCYFEDHYHIDIYASAVKAHCIFQKLLNSADTFQSMLAFAMNIGE